MTTTISLNTTVVRSNSILASSVDNALVMMDIEGGNYFSLDDIGTDIWQRLAEPLKVSELCAQLVTAYAVEPEVCQRDVLKLLGDLVMEQLVMVQD